jgi:mono/diheme cytochrome c family protein
MLYVSRGSEMDHFSSRNLAIAYFTALTFCSFSSKVLAADERAIFMKYGCWQCHGTEGQGTLAGPKLGPNPIPYEGFSAFVRGSSREMPPYRESVLPEPDLVKIHEYLKSRPLAVDTRSLPGQ